MEGLTTKQKIIFISLIVIMIITIGYYFFQNKNKTEFNMYSAVENVSETKEEIEISEEKIIVHIVGCVENEGIVELDEGARVADAIEAAGGLTMDANLNSINLAYPLQDGQKIKIPSNLEEDIDEMQILFNEEQNNKININTATQTELETLPRNRTIYSIKNY